MLCAMGRSFLVLLVACGLHAASLPKTAPEQVGVSAERLKHVTALLDGYIQKGEIAGAVSLVARKGKLVHLQAQGVADLESRKPLSTDAIFRLASMTKTDHEPRRDDASRRRQVPPG